MNQEVSNGGAETNNVSVSVPSILPDGKQRVFQRLFYNDHEFDGNQDNFNDVEDEFLDGIEFDEGLQDALSKPVFKYNKRLKLLDILQAEYGYPGDGNGRQEVAKVPAQNNYKNNYVNYDNHSKQ